jgi:pimeloyl-ACP methyl ester carboxylesterase
MREAAPLVLLHGLSSTPRSWDRLTGRLEDDRRVVPIDLFPRGSPLGRFALTEAARSLATRLQDDGQPVVLIGHSMGGLIALEVAIDHPELVERLILVGTPAVPGEGSLLRRGTGVLKSTGRIQPDTVALLAAGLLRTGPIRLYEALRDTLRADMADRLSEVRIASLLVWGELDTIVSPTVGERMAALMPHADLTIIPGSGHMPQWERPAEFADALRAFLARPVPIDVARGTS